jgi:crossover junction endodeoxyribonuclease RuvC
VIYLGFDPGLSGGLAALGLGVSTAHVMPVRGNEIDARAIGVWVWDHVLKNDSAVVACVEKVGAMPKQGLSSTFKFGKGYGTILGVLGALGVRCELVTPQAWKKVVLAGTDHSKDAAIAWCNRAYPQVSLLATERCRVPHDGMADALCIAEFARRFYK